MARYRAKDSTDLVWNRIRRRITRELDMEIADRREEVLNTLLGRAWEDYTRGLKDGDVIEIEGRYKRLVSGIVTDLVEAAEQEATPRESQVD